MQNALNGSSANSGAQRGDASGDKVPQRNGVVKKNGVQDVIGGYQ